MRPGIRSVPVGATVLVLLVACSTPYGEADEPSPEVTPDAASFDGPARESGIAGMPPDVDASDASDADLGATLLILVNGASKPYRIEATEVTVAQYMRFKARAGPLTFPVDKCPAKTNLGPPAGLCGARFADGDPVTCVDWCDANAYCKAINRRLCGDIGGGPLVGQLENTPSNDAWFFACRGPNGLAYPYGESAQTSACATGTPDLVAVGSLLTCAGAEKGLYDMSGNAAEWTDDCSNNGCVTRGGSYKYTATDCGCSLLIVASPTSAYRDVGFRCCADL